MVLTLVVLDQNSRRRSTNQLAYLDDDGHAFVGMLLLVSTHVYGNCVHFCVASLRIRCVLGHLICARALLLVLQVCCLLIWTVCILSYPDKPRAVCRQACVMRLAQPICLCELLVVFVSIDCTDVVLQCEAQDQKIRDTDMRFGCTHGSLHEIQASCAG